MKDPFFLHVCQLLDLHAANVELFSPNHMAVRAWNKRFIENMVPHLQDTIQHLTPGQVALADQMVGELKKESKISYNTPCLVPLTCNNNNRQP